MNILFSADAFETFAASHAVGLHFGKTFGLFGIGFSVGRNFMRVMNARIRSGVAMSNVIRDTIIFFIVGYAGSAIFSGIANSTAGTTASSTLGITPPAVNSGVNVGAAGDLIVASDKLVNSVTSGVFGLMNSAGVDVAVPAVGGGVLGTIAPSLTLVAIGALIGCLVSLIFER